MKRRSNDRGPIAKVTSRLKVAGTTLAVSLTLLGAVVTDAASRRPETVSPGSYENVLAIADRCPTFSWGVVEGAMRFDLAVYEVLDHPSAGGKRVEAALRVSLPGNAHSWTPSLKQGLEPGKRYVWYLRASDDWERGEWSVGRFFRVEAAPSIEKVAQAIRVLRSYLETNGASQDARQELERLSNRASEEAERPERGAVEGSSEPGIQEPPALTSGTAAIRAESPTTTGENYGVLGVSNSASGAGLAAENTAGGPDLILAGTTTNLTMTESGLDVPSTVPEAFHIQNSDSGTMTLLVDGHTVFHSGNDGAGGGLDADLFDGVESDAFATDAELATEIAGHAHDELYYTQGQLNLDGGGGAVHWNNLSGVPSGFADGIDNDTDTNTTYTAGPGLKLTANQFSLLSGVSTAPRENTLTTLEPIGNNGAYTSVTIGADGLGLISYSTNNSLKVAHCDDVPCTTATTWTLAEGGAYAPIVMRPLPKTKPPGNYGFLVMGFIEGGELKLGECSGFCASFFEVNALVSAEKPSTSIAMGTDGFPVLSAFDNGLEVVHCEDPNCRSYTSNSLDGSGSGEYNSVIIGVDGLPLISYVDNASTGLKVAHCNDVACTSATLNGVDGPASWTSVTVGVDGLPLISYIRATAGQDFLRTAHCDDVTCTTATLNTLDSDPFTSHYAYTSVTIGADGLPLVSYFDQISGDLKVAHCGDIACSNASITTVDSDGIVGEYSSVTIGVDGLPLISYYDRTNETLKVAHCANALCLPYFKPR